MARRARLELPDVPLHVIQRGNNRALCFLADGDRQLYLTCLAGAAARHRCAIHAYVLMPNHVHLLVSPGATCASSTTSIVARARCGKGAIRQPWWIASVICLPAIGISSSTPCARDSSVLRPTIAGPVTDITRSALRTRCSRRTLSSVGLRSTIPSAAAPTWRYSSKRSSQTRQSSSAPPPTNAGDEFVRRIEAQLGRPARALKRGRPRNSLPVDPDPATEMLI